MGLVRRAAGAMGLGRRARFVKGFFNESLPRALQRWHDNDDDKDNDGDSDDKGDAAEEDGGGGDGGDDDDDGDDALPNHPNAFAILR